LREQNEDLSLHVDGTHEGMEETLKEFMNKVADKLDEMGKKICKLELKVKGIK
jgi:UV DNA damage repair endonuclease